jgi:hypothetical protein
LKQLFKVLFDIENVAGYTPASVGGSDQWSSIVNTAEENRQNFCKALGGKTLYRNLYGTYTVALQELKALVKASTTSDPTPGPKPASNQEDGFTEVRRRRRQNSGIYAQTSKKSIANGNVCPRRHPRQGHNEKLLRPTEDNEDGHRLFRFGDISTRRGGPGENVQAVLDNLNISNKPDSVVIATEKCGERSF